MIVNVINLPKYAEGIHNTGSENHYVHDLMACTKDIKCLVLEKLGEMLGKLLLSVSTTCAPSRVSQRAYL